MAVDVGRLCVKIAGRDAGYECLIVDVVDKNYVLIDGNTRRRKCNVDHLDLMSQKADIKKGASHAEVVAALKKLGVKERKRGAPRVKKAETKEEAPKKEKKKGLLKKVIKRKKPSQKKE